MWLCVLPGRHFEDSMLSPTVIGVVLHLLGLKSNFGQVEVQRGEAELDFNLTEMDLSWSCTRWSITDSDQVHRGQVEVQRGEAELDFNLAEMDLIWSCTRRRTSTPRPSPSKPSPSPTRRSRVGLGLGWDGLSWDVLVLLRVQLQCNVDEKGGKYTEAQPRCTCPLFESTLLRSLWWITECNSNAKFTRREASTPRRSRGVLVLPTSQLCIQVGEVHVQLLMDFMLVHWRFCFCKKVRIEWAEWLSDPILNNNAVRVSENIILPGGPLKKLSISIIMVSSVHCTSAVQEFL